MLSEELLPKFANSNSDFPVSHLWLTRIGSNMKLILSKDLAARFKGEVVTQVCQLQFRFPSFLLIIDLSGACVHKSKFFLLDRPTVKLTQIEM